MAYPIPDFVNLTIADNNEAGLIYTLNRDLHYKGDGEKNIHIPCNTIHTQLKLAENTVRNEFLAHDPNYKGNIAVANIGFIVSSHPYDAVNKTHKRRFITIPLNFFDNPGNALSKHHFTAQIRDLWGEDKEVVSTQTAAGAQVNKYRNPKQTKRQERGNSRAVARGINHGTAYVGYDFDQYYHSAGPKLENDFHHSEQAIFEMLQKREVIDHYIKHYLSEYGITAGDKIYGIILDIYTTRYMCRGCSARAYSTAHYRETAMLAAWQKAFEAANIRIPKVGLRIAIRATGEMPALHQAQLQPGTYKPMTSQWLLNPGRGQVNNIVFEADMAHVPGIAGNIINDLFRRTVFLSKEGANDETYVRDKAIDSFKEFIGGFEDAGYGVNNPITAQRVAADPAQNTILGARAKLLGQKLVLLALPAGHVGRKQIAQNLYLPGQPISFTAEEFRGLYFI